MTSHPDTGRTIGAAKDTAAFVRAQHANGVSLETLRRQLGIRHEHMLDMLTRAPEPPLPKVDLARKPQHLPTGGWGARPSIAGSRSLAQIREQAKEDRKVAELLLCRVVPVVVAVTGYPSGRILGSDKSGTANTHRAMCIALMHELAPACPLIAIGQAFNRQANVVERALARCERTRAISPDFQRQYAVALGRLRP